MENKNPPILYVFTLSTTLGSAPKISIILGKRPSNMACSVQSRVRCLYMKCRINLFCNGYEKPLAKMPIVISLGIGFWMVFACILFSKQMSGDMHIL